MICPPGWMESWAGAGPGTRKGSLCLKNEGGFEDRAWEQGYLLFHLQRLFCSISPSDSCSPLFSHPPPLLPHKYFLRTSLHTLLPFSFIDSLVPSPLRRRPWTESTWTFPLFQTLTRAHNGIICQAGHVFDSWLHWPNYYACSQVKTTRSQVKTTRSQRTCCCGSTGKNS